MQAPPPGSPPAYVSRAATLQQVAGLPAPQPQQLRPRGKGGRGNPPTLVIFCSPRSRSRASTAGACLGYSS